MSRIGRAVACLSVVALVASARAQGLPPATGRTFTLSTSLNHKLFIPDTFQHTGQPVDVLFFLHGDPAAVNANAKHAALNTVIVNVTYSGLSSAYQTPFSNPALFGNIMTTALAKLRAEPDFADDAAWGNLGVASFSAGYAGVREILKTPAYYNDIDGLLLADSLHAGYVSYPTNRNLIAAQMVDFRRFATDAASGAKTMILSHSQIVPPDYASTTETANDLIAHIGATSTIINQPGLGTLTLNRFASEGGFAVYGATGFDAAAHTKHLNYMADWLAGLPLAHVPEPSLMVPIAMAALALRRRYRTNA